MTQTTEQSPNEAGRTMAEIVAISEGPAPGRAVPVTRRYRWIPIPDSEEFGYRGWESKMWTNFPSYVATQMRSGEDDQAKKAAFYRIFTEHNGWQFEREPEIPQPGADVPDGVEDFLEAIPQELGNYLANLLGVE